MKFYTSYASFDFDSGHIKVSKSMLADGRHVENRFAAISQRHIATAIFIFRWNLMCRWSTRAIRLKMASWFRRNSAVFWTVMCFDNTCGSWFTSYRDILGVATVVTAPSVVWTRHNVCFCTMTGNFIQPYSSVTSINVSKRVSVVSVHMHQPQVNLRYKWLTLTEVDIEHNVH